MSQALNLKSLTLSGEPILIANNVGALPNGRAGFSVSGGGVLVYHGIPTGPTQQLLWIDRAGKTIESTGTPNAAISVRLSGDGKHVALDEAPFGVSGTISTYDIERGIKAPLITDASGGFFTAWSPDGGKLVYASGMVRGDSGSSLYEKQSNGATAGHQILATDPGVSLSPQDESSDGNILVFTKGIRNQRQLWALPLSGDRKPFQYLADSYDQPQAALSPNGRFLAYTSNESGRYQVVVQPFPNPSGGKWQISVDGGSSPKWRRDGRELYFVGSDGWINAVLVSTDGGFQLGKSTPLFKAPFAPADNSSGYRCDVTADGLRFLVLAPVGTESVRVAPLTVALNWTSASKR